MQASFTDLVGTIVVPAHCFDSAELTDLAPALNTVIGVHEMAAQASEAGHYSVAVPVMCGCDDMAPQASEAAYTTSWGKCN